MIEFEIDVPRLRFNSAVGSVVEAGLPTSKLRAVFRIAVREYRIALRSRWAVGLAFLFAVFSVALVTFGTSKVGPSQYAAVVASLFELGVYLIPLTALAAGYDTVVGARTTGALDMLFALPVSQSQVVLGKYLGRGAVLGGAMVIGLGIGGVGLIAGVGLGGARQYVLFLFASIALAAVFLGISVLVSTLVREKTQALGIVLIVWLWFVLLHDLVALGLVAAMNLPSLVLTGLALLNPVDVFRLLMLSQLETTTGGFATLLTEANLSMPLLLGALAVWLLVPIILATLAIRRHRP